MGEELDRVGQFRFSGWVGRDFLKALPAPSAKAKLGVHVRDRRGGRSLVIPAEVSLIQVHGQRGNGLDAVLDVEIAASVDPEWNRPEAREETARLLKRARQETCANPKGAARKKYQRASEPEREARNAALREARRKGEGFEELARRFGLSRSHVREIVRDVKPEVPPVDDRHKKRDAAGRFVSAKAAK